MPFASPSWKLTNGIAALESNVADIEDIGFEARGIQLVFDPARTSHERARRDLPRVFEEHRSANRRADSFRFQQTA